MIWRPHIIQELKAMRLVKSSVQKVVDHLKKFAKTECPVCHNDQWIISDILFALPEYQYRAPWTSSSLLKPMGESIGTTRPTLGNVGAPIRVTLGDMAAPTSATFDLESENPQVFPVVPVTCLTCGYVFLLSGIKLGVVPGSK
jgi:ribosomal protein S27E